MKHFGLKVGLGLIVVFSAIAGLVALAKELGGDTVILCALALIGAMYILDWFTEWMTSK